MDEELETNRFKEHFKKHKAKYSFGAGIVAGAIFTRYIMRGRYETLANGGVYGPKTIETSVTMRPFSILSSQNNNVVVKQEVGRPGYLVHHLDTDTFFKSQREAARSFDIPEPILSKHLNGVFADAHGHVFERLAVS